LQAQELMVSKRSIERSIQQALQVQTIKKDDYDKKNFNKIKNNSKAGNWSKGNNKGESSKAENSYQNKKKCLDKNKVFSAIVVTSSVTMLLNVGLVWGSKQGMKKNKPILRMKIHILIQFY